MQNLNLVLFLRAVLGCAESSLGGPRSPSFTKKGPGRRDANAGVKVKALFDTFVAAQVQAQKRKAQKKLGHASAYFNGTGVHFGVLHDDIIGIRNNKVTLRNIRVGSRLSFAA